MCFSSFSVNETSSQHTGVIGVCHIYGTAQSKQSKTPERWRIFFFETPPQNSTKMPFFAIFFYIFLLIMMCKLQKKYSFHF